MKIQSLGILGLGSRSTLFYIKELNRLYHQKKGGYSTCPFKLLNTNFDVINNLLPVTSTKLEVILRNYLVELQHLKVDAILIPNITLHETIDKITLGAEIIHPVYVTIAKLKESRVNKVVLLGSLHTMESSYLKDVFKNESIAVVLPSKEDRVFIDNVRKHIYEETESQDLLKEYNDIIEKYSVNYAVVLACTELSVGWKAESSTIIFDMSRIQIARTIENID
ncbi:aspartate/glutamate racemase family protein [Flavobacterium sp.]|uniref:aspartate/glutamate racemase family protein n=1 Tax=Flavobacterium sp. TaxID=239 RepID=UPI003D09A478